MSESRCSKEIAGRQCTRSPGHSGWHMVYSHVAQCNVYTSPEDAADSAKGALRKRSEFYVWRYGDGLYGWSAIPDCTTPGHPAELVAQDLT